MLDCLRNLVAVRPASADGVPDRCSKQHKHQGPTGTDVVPARCPQQHTHEPKLLEPP